LASTGLIFIPFTVPLWVFCNPAIALIHAFRLMRPGHRVIARWACRFAVTYDPSTADSLRAFQAARSPAPGISGGVPRLWGAPA
jgi:hypothetical protein